MWWGERGVWFDRILGCGQIFWILVKLEKVRWGSGKKTILTISTNFLLSHGNLFCYGNRSPKPFNVCYDGCFRLVQGMMGISMVTGYAMHGIGDVMCV